MVLLPPCSFGSSLDSALIRLIGKTFHMRFVSFRSNIISQASHLCLRIWLISSHQCYDFGLSFYVSGLGCNIYDEWLISFCRECVCFASGVRMAWFSSLAFTFSCEYSEHRLFWRRSPTLSSTERGLRGYTFGSIRGL